MDTMCKLGKHNYHYYVNVELGSPKMDIRRRCTRCTKHEQYYPHHVKETWLPVNTKPPKY